MYTPRFGTQRECHRDKLTPRLYWRHAAQELDHEVVGDMRRHQVMRQLHVVSRLTTWSP